MNRKNLDQFLFNVPKNFLFSKPVSSLVLLAFNNDWNKMSSRGGRDRIVV